jgi:predicted nucleic-acid-binding Zn-ribbon protein
MPSTDSIGDSGCPKCDHTEADVDTISTTGGGLSKMFDIQNRKFEVVSCTNCGYSELYRADRSGSSDLVDVFFG